jgi:hypothetical protein
VAAYAAFLGCVEASYCALEGFDCIEACSSAYDEIVAACEGVEEPELTETGSLSVQSVDGGFDVIVVEGAQASYLRADIWVAGTGAKVDVELDPSFASFVEGTYDCFVAGTLFDIGRRETIGFYRATCPGTTTLGDGSSWRLVPGSCR